MTDLDFATRDPVRWLTESDRAASSVFDELVADGLYVDACRALLGHLHHTEHVRTGLLLEGGPVYGTGPAPDFDVAWQQAHITINTALQVAAMPPRHSRIEELMQV